MLRWLTGDHSEYRPNLKNPTLRPTGQGRCLPPGAKLLRFKSEFFKKPQLGWDGGLVVSSESDTP